MTAPSDLPRPADPQRRDVVIYDGDCPVCRGLAGRLHRWDWRGRLAMLPLDDPEVRRRWPELTEEQLREAMHVITPQRRRYRGAGAVRLLARRVPLMWPAVPLLYLPGSLRVWSWLYRALARHRHLLGGRPAQRCCDDVCDD